MKSEFEKYITFHTEQAVGTVNKHLIDSARVSAQRRQRYYWTNITGVTQPEDKGILLKDIVLEGYFTDRDKSHCIDANYFKGGNPKQYFEKSRRQLVFLNQDSVIYDNDGRYIPLSFDKEPYIETFQSNKPVNSEADKYHTLRANAGSRTKGVGISNQTGNWRKLLPEECELLQTVPVGYTSAVSDTQRYKMLGNGWTVDVIAHILSFMEPK